MHLIQKKATFTVHSRITTIAKRDISEFEIICKPHDSRLCSKLVSLTNYCTN